LVSCKNCSARRREAPPWSSTCPAVSSTARKPAAAFARTSSVLMPNYSPICFPQNHMTTALAIVPRMNALLLPIDCPPRLSARDAASRMMVRRLVSPRYRDRCVPEPTGVVASLAAVSTSS
jgi:hypothetical protein